MPDESTNSGGQKSPEKQNINRKDSSSKNNQNKRLNKRRYYNRRRTQSEQNSKPSQPQNQPPRETFKKKFSFKKVTILVPLFNEQESLKPLQNEISLALVKIAIDYEIIFIDDGSTDDSLTVIKELRKANNRIRYISFRKNYGKSAAIDVGFKAAKGDAVITMDADLQDDPGEIANLLAKLDEGYDLVSGWKKKRFDPIIKRYSSKFFNYITRLFSGINIHDFNCGLKAYRKDVVKSVSVYGELHRYIPVLANWQGFTVSEIIVKHHPRRYGKTKFGISRFFKGFVDLITVVFTTRYIRRPMHLFGFLGAISFFAGLVVNGYLTYMKIVYEEFLTNRPLLFFGMLLIIVGVQFFSVGLLGEMLVHTNQDKRDYSIKEQS
ncbi:MAG: glycosyltransferase family 2 protein [Melioribacteraceae bacterium]|nr:glycosyltransferase family 2 protein [Melioribacteraceae bacterium]